MLVYNYTIKFAEISKITKMRYSMKVVFLWKI